MRVLIVDDEPLALDRLSDLLKQIENVELVGDAGTGTAALSQINVLKPDIVFLDIEMPKLDGFDVVESLARLESPAEHSPLICFVTAFPHFALDAFDCGALDFLCKPVRLQRLNKTIERARFAIEGREAKRRLTTLSAQLDVLRDKHVHPSDQSIWVQRSGEQLRLPISTVDWIESDGEYVRLHVGERTFLVRKSLSSIVQELSNGGFIRVHRSAAINRSRLTAVRRRQSGMKVVLVSGVELPVGRRFKSEVDALIER